MKRYIGFNIEKKISQDSEISASKVVAVLVTTPIGMYPLLQMIFSF